jgi:hypothetical protein
VQGFIFGWKNSVGGGSGIMNSRKNEYLNLENLE